jgi:hypothetical protein
MVSPVVVAFGAPPVHVALLRKLSPVEVSVWVTLAARETADDARTAKAAAKKMRKEKDFEFCILNSEFSSARRLGEGFFIVD